MEQRNLTESVSQKATRKRKSIFPGKEKTGLSFNLTALGRQLFKEQSAAASLSNADYLELLIRERAAAGPIQVSGIAKHTGPKGGAKSYFFGKNRGTTTAVSATATARRLVDEQCKIAKMSRGDYIEYLLREKAGLLHQVTSCDAQENQPGQVNRITACENSESSTPLIPPQLVHA